MAKAAKLGYILSVYLVGIVFFTLFRLANVAVYMSSTASPAAFQGLLGKSLLMGWRFDTVVSCYILLLPLVALAVGDFARISHRLYYRTVHLFVVVAYVVCLFACAADIPYFHVFFTRLNAVALNWTDSLPTMLSMLLGEPSFFVYLVVFLLVAVAYCLLMRQLYRKILLASFGTSMPLSWGIPVAVLMVAVTCVGIRGRVSRMSPIRVGTAYFCDNAFLNQLGLNPVFTFVKSATELTKSSNRPLTLIDEEEALQIFATQTFDTLDLPAVLLPESTNVVLVIMESMAAHKTSIASEEESLTPCLDSLMRQSLTFSQTYSAGIHTYNGIYSTLYSHPALLAHHPMKGTPIPTMCGFPHRLHESGYQTAYFLTHDEDFDNMRGFLYANGFDSVVGQHAFPDSLVKGTWGVSDHVLFDRALLHCNAVASKGPFFTAIMTCSDHAPYYLPDGIDFSPRSSSLERAIVEYADWAIGRFVRMASREPWFSNTLFVFVADHGASDSRYDMSLAYHHIPMLFYAPGRIPPQSCDRLALQLDLGPTLLGLLQQSPSCTTFGIDLQRLARPFAYFSSDDKIGVLDGTYFYVYRVGSRLESLYRYSDHSTQDELPQHRSRSQAMRRYAFSMLQSSQQMLLQHSTSGR